MNSSLHLWLIPLLPFAGFLINGLVGRHLPKWLVSIVALLAPLAAFGVVLVAAAEAAVGLAIIIAVFRARATLAVDRIDLMKL